MLANVYLHWFDTVVLRAGGPGNWAGARLVRYADDFVIMAHALSPRLISWVETRLEGWLGLRINRAKTRVVMVAEKGASLDFLGYTFRYDLDLKGRGTRYLNVTPSKQALARERAKLREKTGPAAGCTPLATLVADLNRHLEGWASYFGYGYPRRAYREINSYVRSRMAVHLGRRSQRRYRPPAGVSLYGHLRTQGLVHL